MKIKIILSVLLCFSIQIFNAQSSSADSLLHEISRTKSSDKKAELYLQLSLDFEATDLEKAVLYAQKSHFYAKKNKDRYILSEAYNNLANVYEYLSVSDSSLTYNQKALSLRLKLDNQVKIGDSYNNIAIYYDRIGDFPKSLNFYFKALRYYEKEKDIEKQAMVFSNIGIVYKAQDEFQKALEYYKKASEIYRKLNSDFGTAVCEGNIGSIYLTIGKYDQSIIYSEEAKKLYEKSGYDRFLVYPIINIAIANDSLKNYAQAEQMYLESIDLYKKHQNNYEIANTLNAYAGCLIKQSKYQQSINILIEALEYSNLSKGALLEVSIRKNLATAYAKTNNYKEAFRFLETYAVGKDSLFAQEKTKAVFELEKQYQTEKKEKEILEQRAIIAENSLKIEHKNLQIVLIVFLLLASVLLGYIFYYQQKQKSKRLEKENLLKDAYAKIETQNQLHSQRLKISRDLHDNIGSQLTFIIASIDNIKYFFKETNLDLNKRIEDIGQFTRQTISELRDTIWAMNKDEVSFDDFRVRLSDFINHASRWVPDISFELNVDSSLEHSDHIFSSLEGINLFRVVQEAVNNAVKHSGASKIHIHINKTTEKNHNFLVTVSDNGKGFDLSEKSNGNGLVNMKKRMQETGGDITYSSGQDGTTVEIWQ